MYMKDFAKMEQLEDVVTQMNQIFKLLEGRIEELEKAKPLTRRAPKKETSNDE